VICGWRELPLFTGPAPTGPFLFPNVGSRYIVAMNLERITVEFHAEEETNRTVN